MSVKHHVSDGLLAAYATGELAEGWSLAIATHLALCPECRVRLARFETAAGELMEETAPDVAGIDQSWDAMRRRLVGAEVHAFPVQPAVSAPVHTAVIPEPLRSYLGSDVDGLKWKALGRGASHIMIKTGDGETSVRLLRIPAGSPVPEHSHGGRELTLVLAGCFTDGSERFARGDLEEADETVEHQPIAGAGEDCICLAVTDAPLRFKSRLLRLVQPILGI